MKRLKNPSLDVDVDPILAAIAGAVIVLGGGAAAYGATRDTEARSPAPATAQPADAVVARALKIVSRTDGTVPAADAAAAGDEARAAKLASARGRGTDPFPVVEKEASASSDARTSTAPAGVATNVTPSAASGSAAPSATPSSGSTAASAKAQATAAAAKSDAANAAVQAATGGTSTTAKSAAAGRSSSADARAATRRPAAVVPARVTLRVVSAQRRTTMDKRSPGLLVPGPTAAVARVIEVRESNRVVVLRLRSGAALTGRQSPGTRCIERVGSTGACRLISVHTGRTAVIAAPRTASGTAGAVTALRVLSVWRGGRKVAD